MQDGHGARGKRFEGLLWGDEAERPGSRGAAVVWCGRGSETGGVFGREDSYPVAVHLEKQAPVTSRWWCSGGGQLTIGNLATKTGTSDAKFTANNHGL